MSIFFKGSGTATQFFIRAFYGNSTVLHGQDMFEIPRCRNPVNKPNHAAAFAISRHDTYRPVLGLYIQSFGRFINDGVIATFEQGACDRQRLTLQIGQLTNLQRQTLAIARALLKRSDHTIINEATEGLDIQTQDRAISIVSADCEGCGVIWFINWVAASWNFEHVLAMQDG